MIIRVITSVLVAALLLTGAALAVPGNTEYGAQHTETIASLPAGTAPTEPAAPAPAAAPLTEDEAKAIALDHAGFSADQVTQLRCKYDLDDGVKEYEIDFRSGDWEYDYTVHAESGKILSTDKDYDPPKIGAAQPAPAATEPPATEPPATEHAALLTEDEAKAIALDHAGFSADQVTQLRCKYDVDDGVKEYDVEFRAGGMEYEYEIHAETGKIRSRDKDWDD